jgi:hypothetical protein
MPAAYATTGADALPPRAPPRGCEALTGPGGIPAACENSSVDSLIRGNGPASAPLLPAVASIGRSTRLRWVLGIVTMLLSAGGLVSFAAGLRTGSARRLVLGGGLLLLSLIVFALFFLPTLNAW